VELKGDRTVHIEFNIPARGIIGLRNPLLTATEGEAIIAHRFKGYEPFKGSSVCVARPASSAKAPVRPSPSAINKLQDRGQVLRGSRRRGVRRTGDRRKPQDRRPGGERDPKGKQLTNMRASGSDKKTNIAPAVKLQPWRSAWSTSPRTNTWR
jgi:GTP-binding protein